MKRNPIQDIVRVNNTIKRIDRNNIKEVEMIEREKISSKEESDRRFNERLERRAAEVNDLKPERPSFVQRERPQVVSERPVVREAKPDYRDQEDSFESKIKEPIEEETHIRIERPRKKKGFIFVLIGLLFVGALYTLSVIFLKATIYIEPKQQNFTLTDESFTASREGANGVKFEIMAVEGEESKEVTLTETKQVSSKATGTVVLYNEFSTTAQNLLIKTRLIDDKKNIYFTDKAVKIPGYTTSGGKVVPGSVSVTVTAEKVGESYNGDARDFTLVGFAGTAKATKIYARSKGSLSGGFDGVAYMPSAETKGSINTTLSVGLRSKLEKKLQAQIPEGYIVYPSSMQFKSEFNPDNVQSKTPTTNLVAKGTLTALLLEKETLEDAITKSEYSLVSAEELKEISIPEINNLSFKYSNSSESISKDTQNVSFKLSGTGSLLWTPDTEALKAKIVGINKKELNAIFAEDPGIAHARVVLRPPWKKSLPDEVERIHILEE